MVFIKLQYDQYYNISFEVVFFLVDVFWLLSWSREC